MSEIFQQLSTMGVASVAIESAWEDLRILRLNQSTILAAAMVSNELLTPDERNTLEYMELMVWNRYHDSLELISSFAEGMDQ